MQLRPMMASDEDTDDEATNDEATATDAAPADPANRTDRPTEADRTVRDLGRGEGKRRFFSVPVLEEHTATNDAMELPLRQ